MTVPPWLLAERDRLLLERFGPHALTTGALNWRLRDPVSIDTRGWLAWTLKQYKFHGAGVSWPQVGAAMGTAHSTAITAGKRWAAMVKLNGGAA